MSSEQSHAHHDDAQHESMTKKKIIRVFVYLLIITGIEFFIALILVPRGILAVRYANPLYIALTLLKAFYIVAYFMHLKFERIGLIYTIVIPVLFIIGLILVLTNESHHWIDLRGAL